MKNNSRIGKLFIKNKRPIIFANCVFLLGIIFSLLVIIFAVYLSNKNHFIIDYSYFILFGIISTISFGIALRSSYQVKINLSLLTLTIAFSFYIIEILLEFLPIITHLSREKIINVLDDSFDKRTIFELIQQNSSMGNKIFPNIAPSNFARSTESTANIIPLGGISNEMTALCNESGFWSIYKTDKYGFNNSNVLYDENSLEIILLGDSMTEGYCVKSDENITAVMRNEGVNAVNFGKGGNGPLLNFAALKEYAKELKPKIVLWQFYNNDIYDFVREFNSPILRNYYLEEDFHQNLIERQVEIDELLKIFVIENFYGKEHMSLSNEKKIIDRLYRIIKFANIRGLSIGLDKKPNIKRFKVLLGKAKKITESWGGHFYFIYIPPININNYMKHDLIGRTILKGVAELGIPIIDLQKEVLAMHPDPLSLFPLRKNIFHYNEKAYKLFAEVIISRVKVDGIISPKQ